MHEGGDEAPPAKRPLSETTRHAATGRPDASQTRGTHAMTARARFLQALQQYASDDDDDHNADSHAYGEGMSRGGRIQRAGASGYAMASRRVGQHNTGAEIQPQTSTTSAHDGDFFFGGASGGGGDASRDTELDTPFAGAPAPAPTPAPTRVGLQLLHRMHGDAASTAAFLESPNGFEVVHTYVPLSTGGFLSTATASEDTMEGHQVRLGDVLSLRKPLPGANGSATPSPPPPPLPLPPLPPLTAAQRQQQQQRIHHHSTPTTAMVPSPTTATPATSGAAASETSITTAAHNAMGHFRSAASFTGDEKRYGRRLTPDMTRLLFEVARVDQQGRSLEALFLDGTRAKVAFRDVRPAGYVERTMYASWKADPATRPVHTIHSDASSPTAAMNSCLGSGPHGEARLPGSLSAASSPTSSVPPSGSPTNSASALGAATSGPSWWVIPRLLVRLVTEAAGDWYGKKCVVKTVQRCENRIRLTEWVDEAESKRPSEAVPEARELIGADGLETVVPKKGGRAMVVLGPRRGEMCVVRARVRGPDGDLSAVEVELSRTKELVTLQANELCALAR